MQADIKPAGYRSLRGNATLSVKNGKHSVITTGSATLQRAVNVQAGLFYWFQLPFSLSLPLGHSNLAELQLTGWPPTSLRIQWQRLMTAVTCRGRVFRTGVESRSWKAKAILKNKKINKKMNGFATTSRQNKGNAGASISKHFHAALPTFGPVFSKFLTYAVKKKKELHLFLANLNKYIIMLFDKRRREETFPKTLQPSETLIWPQFLGKLCSRWEYYWVGSGVEKTRIGLMCFVFPSTRIKSGKKAVLFGVLLTSATSLQHRSAHANDELCVTAKALPGSGWGLGGGRARPWELQDTGGKMCGARQRCGAPRVETEA